MIDDETKALACLALRNAFYEDFSALVNIYLKFAEGVDPGNQDVTMSVLANVFARDFQAESDAFINLYTVSPRGTFSHTTMKEALENPQAAALYLQGKKVFERRDGTWYYIEK
jgi:hypothetical protein